MLGIGFFELVIIVLVGFIAIGPKELPVLMRKLAGFYRQMMALKSELSFQIMSADEPTKKIATNKIVDAPAKDVDHG